MIVSRLVERLNEQVLHALQESAWGTLATIEYIVEIRIMLRVAARRKPKTINAVVYEEVDLVAVAIHAT
jgi:hypothetical protein